MGLGPGSTVTALFFLAGISQWFFSWGPLQPLRSGRATAWHSCLAFACAFPTGCWTMYCWPRKYASIVGSAALAYSYEHCQVSGLPDLNHSGGHIGRSW